MERSKLQPPILRHKTLPRGRLLDWLGANVQRRLILVTAEAGYGKSTLVADFVRRTRVRTLWYRIDAGEDDLVTFVAYLVAAGKEHRSSFGEGTLALLGAGDATGLQEALLDSLLAELRALGPEHVLLVLDDFHLVDQCSEVVDFISAVLRRADTSLSILVASRRSPDLAIGRLRVQGEVVELGREQLRFQLEETAQLFSEVFDRQIEPSTLHDLNVRTEGWAASLHLVEAATRPMSEPETRAFIHSLSGAAGEIHDFLAEEVVSQLTAEQQEFVMRLSLLDEVDETTAGIACGARSQNLAGLLSSIEKSGLLVRRGVGKPRWRFHPLVQEFLQARLVRKAGPTEVASVHRRVAEATQDYDWATACWHYDALGDHAAVRSVLSHATTRIMATGNYSAASRFLADGPPYEDSAVAALVLSRRALATHDVDGATLLARKAVELAEIDDAARGNLVSVLIAAGELSEARQVAVALRTQASDPQLRQVAEVTVKLIEASVAGDLRDALVASRGFSEQSRAIGARRYEAVGLLNAAEVWRAIGRPQEALAAASEARHLLGAGEFSGESATAVSVRAWAVALTDGLERARQEFAEGTTGLDGPAAIEVLAEFALVEGMYGDAREAGRLLSAARTNRALKSDELREKVSVAELVLALRRMDAPAAGDILASIRAGAYTAQPGREAFRLVLHAHLAVLRGDASARGLIADALRHAQDQGCEWLVPYCSLLEGLTLDDEAIVRAVGNISRTFPGSLSPLAELILGASHFPRDLVEQLRPEVTRFPLRWLPALRDVADNAHHRLRLPTSQLLDLVGTREDVARLRRIAKTTPGTGSHRELGRALARRLASPVFIEDQGKVTVYRDGAEIPSRHVRRKVLALLCFLLTKPRFTAPRDEVLDNLWPDMDPVDALNSLNQTVYFLRRVFEPKFVEDLSPGYIYHDSELIWLDSALVQSRSAMCSSAIAALGEPPAPPDVDRLASLYRDRFALDFAYEDWASSYRDTQHAAYLRAIEEAVRLDAAAGHFQRGVELARRALAIDPDATEVEEALLRLYRLEGAHAAAAEQYGHYSAAARRALDAEPPPLESF